MRYDAFISHAGEDKEALVRPLAERLRDARLEIWYDEFELRVGDGLRRSIDRGLREATYGIVILSPYFFGKHWPEWELDGLVQLHHHGHGDQRLLPVWHQVGHSEVSAYSAPLANIRAVSTDRGLDDVVAELLRVLRPAGSTLVVARDTLIDLGVPDPPVVTDDWWLDVVEASVSNDVEGTFQESMGWGRWGFPLPERSIAPADRGNRLGWAAAQMLWQAHADQFPITQITHPTDVHRFIDTQPGLLTSCELYP